MSDTATTATSGAGLDSAGAAPAGSADHHRKSRRSRRWQNNRWDTTPPSVLVEEAARLTEARDRRRATKLLAVAATTTDGQQRQMVLERLAVTAADGGRHRVASETVFELQQVSPRNADIWVTFANVALSRGNYVHADSAARSALELDGSHQGAWAALAAGYAGLGWFEKAESCLDRLDRDSLTGLEEWRIGRAVNRWALNDTRWVVAAAISAVLLGVLAVAIAATTPFATRGWRLRQMRRTETGKALGAMATSAWRFERRLRLWHLGIVTSSVVTFILTLIL